MTGLATIRTFAIVAIVAIAFTHHCFKKRMYPVGILQLRRGKTASEAVYPEGGLVLTRQKCRLRERE